MHSKQNAHALAARCAPGVPWGNSDAIALETHKVVPRMPTRFTADTLRVCVEEIGQKYLALSPEWSRATTTAITKGHIKFTGAYDTQGVPIYTKGDKA